MKGGRILMRRSIDQEIENFISSISNLWTSDEFDNEPLDGDETQEIADRVLAELNEVNGNK